MSKAYAEANAKKKKKNQETAQKVAQSPSVSERRKISEDNMNLKQTKIRQNSERSRAETRKLSSTNRRYSTTAAQRQKMGMPTESDLRLARKEREQKAMQRLDNAQRQQRIKLGIESEEDRKAIREQHDTAKRAIRNTPGLAKKAVKDTIGSHAQTIADITEMTASNKNGTDALAMKMGIDKDDVVQRAKLEGQRQKTVKKAKEDRLKFAEAQDKRQKEWDEKTKDAKGLEKAYYGAVESGVGMATDLVIGLGTQGGALAAMGSRTYGQTRGQAEKEGATENEDRVYALMQAGKEVATELMFPGVGLARGYAGKVGLPLAERVANRLTKNIANRTAADIAGAGTRLLGGTVEENLEEIAGWGADPLIKEIAYGRNLRTRQAQNVLQQESDALRANLQSEDDARYAAAYLSSDSFIEQNKKQYMDAGLSEEQAEEVAIKMRDYLTASLTGDTKTMESLEDEIVSTIAGKTFSRKDWDLGELKDTIASTSLLTLTTGLPSGVSTAVRGSMIRDELGDEGVRALANTAIDFEDSEASLRAEVAKERLDSGKELTVTQVYDLAVAQDQQVAKDINRVASKNSLAAREIKEQDLVTPKLVRNEDGSIMGDEVIAREYASSSESAAETIKAYDSEGTNSLTPEEVDTGARAIAGFKTGAFTVNDANALNYSNTAVRAAFVEETGIDLNQYIVKKSDGSVDIPATNTRTKDALFAMAADNLVKSAQAETLNWMDKAKGETVSQITQRMDSQGALDLQKVLDDVDERDRSTYLMVANASDMAYQAGRNIGTEWDDIKNAIVTTYPGVSETKLQAMYEAGRTDRKKAADKAATRSVQRGQSMSKMGDQENPMGGQVFYDRENPPKGSVIRTFSEIAANLGVNIHLVSEIYDQNGNVVKRANGQYFNGEIYINVKTAIEKNIGFIFMHEFTHHLKKFAPEEYLQLENLVREKWFKKDPSQMQDAIQQKIEEYKSVGKLTEEMAMEEIIADSAHEFLNDENFVREVAEENPTLAQAIINSIKNVLRKLRQLLAEGEFTDETHMASLFSELDIMAEAEELWLNAAKAAKQVRANQAIDEWDAKARQERSPVSDSNISSYSTGAYSGQVNMRTEYKDNSGNVLGYVEWNDYEGTPSISYIHVDENSRRQGIATKLLQDIQRQYPDTEINFGMTTEDGTALVDAVTHEVVVEELQTKQNDLSRKRQELEEIESRLNELYENDELSEEQDAEASELGTRWDDLNREVHDLDEEIGSRSATKRMVNMPDVRFSITEDSSGKELTEGQKEYFKDSKIVDAEGRLKVMYHGTPNMGFTVFDRRKTRPGTLGRGFYFSDQDSHAGQYGARYEVYLNITQPLGTDTNDITKDQLRAFVEEIAEDEDYGLDNYGYGATVDSVVDDVWGKSDFRMMQDINLACVGDMAEAVKLFNSVNGTNYDGIVTDLETVAFYPEQIKNIDNENPTEDPDIRYSVTTDKEDFIKGANLSKELRDWAKEIGLDKLSKQPVKGPVIVSVRDLRTAWYQKNGRAEEAEVINTVLDKIGDSLTQLVGKYQYIDLGDALNAAVTYRTDAEGHPTSVILSCQVKNAEYEVNFDFTTICAKRLAMQKILERFIKTEGERQGTTLYDELKLDEEGLYKLRLILETAGFDVSCRGCFVEQNRYSQQNQARTIANDWNAALDEWAKDNGTEVTENFGLTTLDINNLDYDEIEAAFERYHELMKGQKTDVATKNRMLIESSPFFRKRMNASDYASMAGQRALMAIGESKKGGTNLYGLLKRGQSDSKQSVPFTAYNGEISLLPDNMKGKSLYDYLLSIGGARAQSASDFQIEFVYDYMQMVADLSARGLPMHMYTKVIELAELFGMTGIKINLSAMCDVADDLGGEYAGLKLVDGKYEYNISDQSIDYPKAVELQKKDGYSKNIGIIMVTLSSQHMLKSLDDPDVRYIIGYHSSAMPVVVANMSNMGGATDYTKINKTNKLNEKGKALFDEAMKEAKGKTALDKYKNALRIFDEKIQEETAKKKKKPRRGNEYGAYMSAYGNNTADFNTYDSLLETKDARKTADKYLEHCMKNDLIPIYFPFAFHENYYKCEVYDFNMYDNNTGEYAPMESVQNIYPGLNMAAGETDTTAFTNRVSEMMDEQNRVNQSLDSQYDAVFDEAKDTLKFSITGDDYMDFDASGIEHSELTHRADAIKTEAQLRDEAYMDAVNSNNMEEAQRLVDEAAKRSGLNSPLLYHGTYEQFTTFKGNEYLSEVNGLPRIKGYFSEDRGVSEIYGDVSQYYVGINNPLDFYDVPWSQTESEWRKWFEGKGITDIKFDSSIYNDTLKEHINDLGENEYSVFEIFDGVDLWVGDGNLTERIAAAGYDGMRWDYDEKAWIPFNANAIKSADPVTYREDGSVIPLSERFDPSNDDIRYSLPTQDSDGNILSDGQMEYFKNSQARDKQGRLVPVYHTTPDAGFTVFDSENSNDGRSLFFTSDRGVSASYSNASGALPAIFDPYEGTAPKRTVSNVETLPEDILFGDGLSKISNIKVMDSNGREIAAGDDFVNVAIETGRYLESQGYDLYDDFDVDSYLVSDSTNMGNKRGEAMDLYRNLEEGNFRFTMEYSDPYATYAVYLNLENPLRVDADNSDWNEIPFNGESYNTRELAKLAQDQGNDGVIIENVVDYGDTENYGDRPADVYIAFNSNQVKDTRNTDPSENPDIRFSLPSEDDIVAYALERANSTDELWYSDPVLEEGRIRYSLTKDDFINSKSEYWNPAWLTEGYVLEEKSVKDSIRNVIKGAMMNSDTTAQYRTELVDKAMKVAKRAYKAMKRGDHSMAASMLFETAYDMIHDVEFFMDDSMFDTYMELRDYFKATKIFVPRQYRSDMEYNSFRKRNMGRILLRNDGVAVDEVWQQLNEKWPEWFSDDIEHPAEMMLQIEHVLDVTKPMAIAYSSEEAMDFAGDIASDLYDIIYEGKEFKSLADKYDEKTKALKARHQEAMQKMRQSLEDERERRREAVASLKAENKRNLKTQKKKYEFEIAELKQNREYNIQRLLAEKNREVAEARKEGRQAVAEARKEGRQAVAEARKEGREQREAAVAAEKQKRKDEREKRKAREAHRKQFNRIRDNYDWFATRLVSPTKDKNIPEQLRVPLAKLLMQLDLQTERSKALEEKYGVAKSTLQMRELKDKLANVAKEDDSGDLPYNSWLADTMEWLADQIDDEPIDSLTTTEIEYLNTVLTTIKYGIENHRKVRINGKLEEIASYGDKMIATLKERIAKFGQRKEFNKGTLRKLDTLVNEGEETPTYFFERLDPKKTGLGAMYRELRKGEDKHIRNMNYLRKKFKEITGKYANSKKPGSSLEDWRSLKYAVTVELSSGPITLTQAQLMSLYCLSKRPEALNHILVGGISIMPVSFGAKMLSANKTSSTKISYEELLELRTKLTPEQMDIADKLQSLMANEMAAWGNETSMEMYGIKMFRDPAYFPMRSSQMELPYDVNNPQKSTAEKIRNFGFTKPLTPNANNAIYIDDIFSVVADHCNKMSLYNALAVPIMDFMKVYNYKQHNDDGSTVTVKETIGDAFTSKANAYIEKFLADVNGNTKSKSDAVDDLFKKALANYKKASIGANMRVALQQPTAIFRAFMVLDPKYFVGIKPISVKDAREMFEHCPIALWKSWGHYDMDMGHDIEDIMMNKDWTRTDIVTMGLYGLLDNWAWSMIWQAVKNEVRSTHKGIDENSDEFFELCNERASEVFDKTQVVDSIFHRSDTMRSKNTLTKMATSFMAEPTLTYNVFRDSLVRAIDMLRQHNYEEAGKIFAKMALVLGLNAAAVSASAAIWDAVRGKGDDDDDPKSKYQLWLDNFKANFLDNAPWAQWNNIYFIKDIVDLAKNAEKGFGTSNMALEGFETLFKGITQLKKKANGGAPKTKWIDIFTNLLGGIGYVFGFPAKTVMRDLVKPLFEYMGVSALSELEEGEDPKLIPGGFADNFTKLFAGGDGGSEGGTSSADEDAGSDVADTLKLGKKAVKTVAKTTLKKRDKTEAELLADIKGKTIGYSGADRDKRIWDIVSDGYTEHVEQGDYAYVDKMRRVVQAAGGDLNSFDKKIFEASKTAMKKTIISDPTQAQIEQQDRIKDYLLNHGMTIEEISSEICYKSNTARDLKAAMRMNNVDYMVEELVPLLRAGMTRDDIYKLYKYRNMGAKTYDGKYSDPKYRQSTGKYQWPITGQITSQFGEVSSIRNGRTHAGLDIAGNMGDPISAADGGTVVYVGWYGGGGNTVMIQHDDGTITEYMHMSAFNCKEGDTVSQGQTIGAVGSTGNSTGPHCHFGVKVNGEHVDPLTYLNG